MTTPVSVIKERFKAGAKALITPATFDHHIWREARSYFAASSHQTLQTGVGLEPRDFVC